jgi:superfamily I DNA/RNA helicase
MPDFIFRLPQKLTDAQLLAIDFYDDSLIITGGPGSGKTTVTLYRFLRPIKNKENALLFTYNRTLLASIKGILRNKSEELFGSLDEDTINNIINNKVISFYKWFAQGGRWFDPTLNESEIKDRFSVSSNLFTEVFFDEGQDLTPAVFANAFLLAPKITCGADNAQDLQSNFPPDEALSTILDLLNNQSHTDLQPLSSNFRNTKEIFDLARSFVPDDASVQNINIQELKSGDKPEIIDSLDDQNQLNKIKEIITANSSSNIGILVNYGNQVLDIKKFLELNQFSCQRDAANNLSFSYYYNGMPFADETIMFDHMKTPFICTYDSCKGLEFDIVILPFFNDAERALYKPRKRKVGDFWIEETNADGSTKMWATRNHYYVGATRARTKLYIMCNEIPDILKTASINAAPNNLYDEDDDLPF